MADGNLDVHIDEQDFEDFLSRWGMPTDRIKRAMVEFASTVVTELLGDLTVKMVHDGNMIEVPSKSTRWGPRKPAKIYLDVGDDRWGLGAHIHGPELREVISDELRSWCHDMGDEERREFLDRESERLHEMVDDVVEGLHNG